jgi:glycosyltransferase 2 family protein
VLRQGCVRALLASLRPADPAWLQVAGPLERFRLWVSVKRWKVLTASQGHAVPVGRLGALYLIGRFYNNILASTVGGDVVRAYELKNNTNSGNSTECSNRNGNRVGAPDPEWSGN